jgi:hypothetical protein
VRRILLVEIDPGLRNALQRGVEQHEGCCRAPCADADAARGIADFMNQPWQGT